MAFEFLYILQVCWLSSMGSTRRGDTSQLHNNDTFPSARPTLSSSNQHPGSSPRLSYVSPDTTFLRHNPGNYCSATLLSNLCPTLLPHNPSPVGYYPDQPRPIHRSIPQSYFTSPPPEKIEGVLAPRPRLSLQDTPCTTYTRWTRPRPANHV